jgi:hypothetical protein
MISRLGLKIHRLTASAANACGFLLTPKTENASHRQLALPSLRVVRKAFPMLANGDTPGTPESGFGR